MMLARLRITPCSLRLCGHQIPARKVRAYLHVSACILFVADCAFGLVFAYCVPHAVQGLAGGGSKLAAVIESVSMFIEERT